MPLSPEFPSLRAADRSRPMRHPPLRSLLNPAGPEWLTPYMPEEELTGLRRSLALLVGYDTDAGVVRVLGSGYIIHHEDLIYILTAVHVLQEFCRQFLGPHIQAPTESSADWRKEEQARLRQVLLAGAIKVLVETAHSPTTVQLDPRAAGFGTDERGLDVAILQCAEPGNSAAPPEEARFTPLQLDLEPVRSSEVLFMAGFADLPNEIPLAEADRVGQLRRNSNIVLRAGYVRETTNQADGYHKGAVLMRANIPSEPGMSGGPLMRKREPSGRPGIQGAVFQWMFTALGIVSRHRYGGMFQHFENKDGETWIVPISQLQTLNVTFGNMRVPFPLFAALRVVTYQDIQGWVESMPQLPEGSPRREVLDVSAILARKAEMVRSQAEQLKAQLVAAGLTPADDEKAKE